MLAERPLQPATHLQGVLTHPGLWLALALGLALKVVILTTGASTFDGDEAILALMARHILQGEPMVFFYGQAYMGALDAYLIAAAFALFRESVLAVRMVQVLLYLGVLLTTYVLAWRLTEKPPIATAAALLIAVPPVLFSTYTTATLGNYVEVLLINNLLFLIVWDVLTVRSQHGGWWFAAGVLAGLGWWGMALVVVAIAPLAVIGLWRFRKAMPWGKVALLVAGFLIGASPWVGAIVSNPSTVFADLGGARVAAENVVGPGEGLPALLLKPLNLILFNLTALFGLRPSWSVDWIALPVGLLVGAFYVLVLVDAVRKANQGSDYQQVARQTLLGGWLLLIAAFLLTRFGVDPTGRYLLHLYPPLILLTADWLARQKSAPVVWGVLGVLLAFNLWGNVYAILNNPPGLTTQFNPIAHIPHDHDDELMAFLESIGAEYGYTNYWVAYRFAFLSGEQLTLTPALPYQEALTYTPTYDRYPAYTQAVRRADHPPVYITSNHPILDEVLHERFAALGVSYEEQTIGPYTVFYGLSRHVFPEELGTLANYYPTDG